MPDSEPPQVSDAARAVAEFFENEHEAIARAIIELLPGERARAVRSNLQAWLHDTANLLRGRPGQTFHWVARMGAWVTARGELPGVLIAEVPRYRRWFLEQFSARFPDTAQLDLHKAVLRVQDEYIEQLVKFCLQAQQQALTAQRRRQSAMVEVMDRPFALLDVEGRLLVANSACTDLWGFSQDALVGRPFVELCADSAAAEIRRALRQRTSTNPRTFMGDLLVAQGRRIPAAFTAQPLFDLEGKRDGLALGMRNLSQLHERPLPDRVRGFEEIAAALHLGFELIDTGGTVQYTSESARKLLDNHQDTPLTFALMRAGGIEAPEKFLHEAITEHRLSIQVLSHTLHGEQRWFMVAIAPQRAHNDEVTRVLCIMQDVTHQHDIETRIVEHQRTSLASQLAMTVAHQLRNPLGVMIGYAEMIASGLPIEQIYDATERILRNGLRCKKIVEDLLEFGQGASDVRQPVEINAFIRDLVMPQFSGTGKVHLDWRLAQTAATLMCVPQQLAQVFFSLIDNALRAANTQVSLGVEVLPDRVRVHICDDGPGVSPDIRDRMFEPFFTTRKQEGAVGLGLSLAHHAVQDYGGRLYVEDNREGGACFVIELPITHAVSPGGIRGEHTGVAEKRRRLLIVDDELDLLVLLKSALTPHHFEVHTVATGTEALQLLERNRYDGAVLDVQLPGELTGPQLFQYIRGACPHMLDTLMFITADTMNFETRKFIDDSQHPHMEKPFLISTFVKRIKELFDEE
ncbi:MAG: ATP-binding protein [Candidatus Hydrogenedentota bacterium]